MTIGGIISAIIVGLIIGALGRVAVPGKQSIPVWLTIIVGIGAAFLGTAVARGIGYADTDGFDWLEFFTQVAIAAAGVAVVAGAYGRRTLTR
ncbi:MAG: GlsB/YeaQ/YmgE family stress response membrane protein [Mycobacteriaceae bacterium]|nr:GlsB/YeaQ/YmgE family stress response membrane protein [Mycobacteriaceae bacterium]